MDSNLSNRNDSIEWLVTVYGEENRVLIAHVLKYTDELEAQIGVNLDRFCLVSGIILRKNRQKSKQVTEVQDE